jgi:hypothetical protein
MFSSVYYFVLMLRISQASCPQPTNSLPTAYQQPTNSLLTAYQQPSNSLLRTLLFATAVGNFILSFFFTYYVEMGADGAIMG